MSNIEGLSPDKYVTERIKKAFKSIIDKITRSHQLAPLKEAGVLYDLLLAVARTGAPELLSGRRLKDISLQGLINLIDSVVETLGTSDTVELSGALRSIEVSGPDSPYTRADFVYSLAYHLLYFARFNVLSCWRASDIVTPFKQFICKQCEEEDFEQALENLKPSLEAFALASAASLLGQGVEMIGTGAGIDLEKHRGEGWVKLADSDRSNEAFLQQFRDLTAEESCVQVMTLEELCYALQEWDKELPRFTQLNQRLGALERRLRKLQKELGGLGRDFNISLEEILVMVPREKESDSSQDKKNLVYTRQETAELALKILETVVGYLEKRWEDYVESVKRFQHECDLFQKKQIIDALIRDLTSPQGSSLRRLKDKANNFLTEIENLKDQLGYIRDQEEQERDKLVEIITQYKEFLTALGKELPQDRPKILGFIPVPDFIGRRFIEPLVARAITKLNAMKIPSERKRSLSFAERAENSHTTTSMPPESKIDRLIEELRELKGNEGGLKEMSIKEVGEKCSKIVEDCKTYVEDLEKEKEGLRRSLEEEDWFSGEIDRFSDIRQRIRKMKRDIVEQLYTTIDKPTWLPRLHDHIRGMINELDALLKDLT